MSFYLVHRDAGGVPTALEEVTETVAVMEDRDGAPVYVILDRCAPGAHTGRSDPTTPGAPQ